MPDFPRCWKECIVLNWGGGGLWCYPAKISLDLAHFCSSHIVYGKLRISFLKKKKSIMYFGTKRIKECFFWMRMRTARNWQHPMMNQYRWEFKDHFIFALSTSLTKCLQRGSGFFLPVWKRNNTFMVLFRQNTF